MSAYNFDKRFAAQVASGVKRQTIRRDRKRGHARTGERVQLYTGRSSSYRKLVDPDPVCTLSTYCAIREDGVTTGNMPSTNLDEFAALDGFESFEAMKGWFRETYGLPFIGQLIRWEFE